MAETIEDRERPTHPEVPAKWTDDCQGKKDFDGELVRLSTRYWPGSYQANGWPSAKAELHLVLPDAMAREGWQNWRTLVSAKFEAPTQEEVQRKVEEWAIVQYRRVDSALFFQFQEV